MSNPTETEAKFRESFLKFLETVRFSLVVLKNRLDSLNGDTKSNDKIQLVPELTEGKQSFITLIENLKHDVKNQSKMDMGEIEKLVERFQIIKRDVVSLLQAKMDEQDKIPLNPPFSKGEDKKKSSQGFFTPVKHISVVDVLQSGIDQINRNSIGLSGKQLAINPVQTPEEMHADKLSSGSRTHSVKRL